MADPIISARDISRSFYLGTEEIQALKRVNITLFAGEFAALAGPSGSGKTTLLHILGCIDSPDEGSIAVCGMDVVGQPSAALANLRLETMGFIFQTFNLIPVLNAWENVELPLLFRKRYTQKERGERVRHVLEKVGLGERVKSYPSRLSGGERQRVAIARALAGEPKLILADEPTANLDHRTGGGIVDLLERLCAEERVTVFIASHDETVLSRAKRRFDIRDGVLRTSPGQP